MEVERFKVRCSTCGWALEGPPGRMEQEIKLHARMKHAKMSEVKFEVALDKIDRDMDASRYSS